MKTLLSTTTANHSLDPPFGRRLLTVPSGAYAGRMVALLQTSTHDLYFICADPPYDNWSTAQLVSDGLADFGFDAVMSDTGDIHVVYPEWSTSYAKVVKLTFSAGEWTAGTPVDVYNNGLTDEVSITRDASGALWAVFVKQDGPFKYIHAKRSTDDGATWGSGPADEGTVLSDGVSQVSAKLLGGANSTYVIYTRTSNEVVMRICDSGSTTWSEPFVVVTDPVVDEHFDAAISAGGMLGVVYDSGDLRYREFNGVNWSAISIIDADGGAYPQLLFEGEVPVVFYMSDFGVNQKLLKYSHRRTGEFSAPEIVDPQTGTFDAVVLYNQTSAAYANLTTEAADDTASDVVHPDSSALVAQSGDAIYLGRDETFRLARIVLSTAGSGGALALSYFDGTQWQAFTPVSGSCELNASDQLVVFFEDDSDLPQDWQRTTVNGQLRYWIRLVVTTSFATAPVGSQLTAIGDVLAVQVGR